MRWLLRLCLFAAVSISFGASFAAAADTEKVERYLFASVHRFAEFHNKQGRTNFHAETEQGVFVYDINGDYGYASNKVIDAKTRKIVATLNGLNEASLEIQIKDGKVVRTGHEMGSGLDMWVEGFDLPAKP